MTRCCPLLFSTGCKNEIEITRTLSIYCKVCCFISFHFIMKPTEKSAQYDLNLVWNFFIFFLTYTDAPYVTPETTHTGGGYK